jgi:hypothetical protein
MDGNGALSDPMKQGFTSLALGLLNHLENQILERERIKSIAQVKDLYLL